VLLRAEPLTIIGLDIEAQHGATWGRNYDARMFFGAAMVTDDADVYLPPRASTEQLEAFVLPLREPNVLVVGHNVTYDTDGLNGELIRTGLDPLPPLLISDTMDIPRHGQMFGKSLADMCEWRGVVSKGSMSRYWWEAAYRLEPEALKRLRLYNMADVYCTLALRLSLLDGGLLGKAKTWTPRRPK
jgi:hypothetical protein